jgi:hypothetical protein
MTTNTTNHLYISRRDRLLLWWHHADKVVLSSLVALALLIIGALVLSWLRSPHSAPQAMPTPALSIVIATPSPAPAQQVAAALPNTLRAAVVAFDAPDGNVLGAIEAGRAYQLLARWGADWLQADVQGSGVVWLRASEVLELPSGLADMQPPPAPEVVYVTVRQPVEAVPTPGPELYSTASQGVQPDPREQLIGDDPNAPACIGPTGIASPLCGGLTNAEARAALDAQRRMP